MIGCCQNLICYRNASESFEFLWINIPFSRDKQSRLHAISSTEELSCENPWKCIEQLKLEEIERKKYEFEIKTIETELSGIKKLITAYIAANEQNELFPLQFFNLNSVETNKQSELRKQNQIIEQNTLEAGLSFEYQRIENIKKYLWNNFEVKPLKVCGIFAKIYIDNFPLTSLDDQMANDNFLKNILTESEILNQICSMEIWNRRNVRAIDKVKWFEIKGRAKSDKKHADRFTTFASKIIDQNLSTNVAWSHNFIKLTHMECKSIDITSEYQLNVYNINVYVSSNI